MLSRVASPSIEHLRESLAGLPVGDGLVEANPGEAQRERRAEIPMRALGVSIHVRWRPHPQGLDVEMLNTGDDVIDEVRLWVVEMLRRTNNDVDGKVSDFHNSADHSFPREELHAPLFPDIGKGARLFPGDPVTFRYLVCAPGKVLRFGVSANEARSGGRWRTDFLYRVKDGKRNQRRWNCHGLGHRPGGLNDLDYDKPLRPKP